MALRDILQRRAILVAVGVEADISSEALFDDLVHANFAERHHRRGGDLRSSHQAKYAPMASLRWLAGAQGPFAR
jgi:hypothetical protein